MRASQASEQAVRRSQVPGKMEVLMLRLEDCINETCPWSGKPVQADSLTRYRGQVVGFCNPGCRG